MTARRLVAALAACGLAAPVAAGEGMFTPGQLPAIAEDLEAAGLKLDPARLADLTGHPMGAVVIVGGCSGSFVSPRGLVATNHHCAMSDIQYNSTEANNYLEDGFLAGDLAAERPASPNSRIFVTVAVEDVTGKIPSKLGGRSGRDLYDKIEASEKQLVRRCEADPGHRCRVAAFFGGLQYRLIKRLEIRDVRLVYAPPLAIGKYGGEIDNWEWPRHTGDFAFFRGYVAPDGSAADYSADNVPYAPDHYLKVSAAGVNAGDFVMAAGYPGSTSRYARLSEVRNTFDWRYPTTIELFEGWTEAIEDAAPEGSEARLKYASRLAGIANGIKNIGGQLAGARRADLIGRRAEREAALDAWIGAAANRKTYANAVAEVDRLAEDSAREGRRNDATATDRAAGIPGSRLPRSPL